MPIVGLLSIELHLPHARSLKDKRAVLRSVKDRLRKLNVAVAEVDHHGLWQRARLGIVAVGQSQAGVEQTLDAVVEQIERHDPGLIVERRIDWLA